MKTLEAFLIEHFVANAHSPESALAMARKMFADYADRTQVGMTPREAYYCVFNLYDPQFVFLADKFLSQFNNYKQSDVSKIVPLSYAQRILAQRETVADAVEHRDAAYLAMRERNTPESVTAFVVAYSAWKDEALDLARMIGE